MPHRTALARTIVRYSASAAASHAGDAWRATLQSRPRSTRENSSASRPMLTVALIALSASDRARAGRGESSVVVINIYSGGTRQDNMRMLQLPVLQHAHPDDR